MEGLKREERGKFYLRCCMKCPSIIRLKVGYSKKIGLLVDESGVEGSEESESGVVGRGGRIVGFEVNGQLCWQGMRWELRRRRKKHKQPQGPCAKFRLRFNGRAHL